MSHKVLNSFALAVSMLSVTACASLFPSTRGHKPSSSQAVVKDVPFAARPSADADLRKRVIVLPFLDAKPDRSKDVAEVARKTVVSELFHSRRFVIIDNSDLPENPEKYINENSEYDLEAIGKTAQNMGIAAVIEGKVLEVGARRVGDQIGVVRKLRARVDAKVQIRVVASKTGREILNEIKTATVESETTRVGQRSYSDRNLAEDPKLIRDAVHKAVRGTSRKIAMAVEKLAWEGRVALVSGERVFINAGRLSGIQIGDVLRVTEPGDEVFDPQNGLFIGQARGRMKGTLEVISYFGKDGAISIIHSGSGFQENDRVELY